MSMNDEFSELEYKNYQNEFLEDWWTRKKLFKGMRQSGKTELLLSELYRFQSRNFDCLVIAPTERQFRQIENRYIDRFEQHANCDFTSKGRLQNGSVRGYRYDVVLVDEIQETGLKSIQYEVDPMDPMFLRATSCISSNKDINEDYFDSVYRV
jgi:superfamily II DNA or RNA helicase